MIKGILDQIYRNREIVYYQTEWQKACRLNDKRINWHRSAEYPEELLGGIRPSEEEIQKAYRREVYKAVGSKTRPQIGSIETALDRIQQSDDFKIQFETDFKETKIVEENSLQKYLEEKLPLYKSGESWLFGPAKTEMIWSPNSFLLVLPELQYFKVDATGRVPITDATVEPNPYPRIFPAYDVVWVDTVIAMFQTGKYTNSEKQEIYTFVAITKDQVAIIERKPNTEPTQFQDYHGYEWSQVVFEYVSEILPVFPLGHLIDCIKDEKKVYKSVVSNGLSNLNDAARSADDLNVIRSYHIHPKYWEVNTENCKTCSGEGVIWGGKDSKERVSCTTCHGGGFAVESPFNKLAISFKKLQMSDDNGNMANIPFPWAGYIERPIEIFKTYKEDFDDECMQFFSANNIEFLNEVPLNESGKAKEVDKEEVHTFFYPNAVQLKYLYESLAYACYLQIYKPLAANGLLDSEATKKALPKITVPTEFDILTSGALSESLAQRIKEGMDSALIEGGTIDLLKKQYGENSSEVKKYRVRRSLDPLNDKTDEAKSIAFADRAITQTAYVMSWNMDGFIERALQEVSESKKGEKDFYLLPRVEQVEIMARYTKEAVTEINKSLVNIPEVPVGA